MRRIAVVAQLFFIAFAVASAAPALALTYGDGPAPGGDCRAIASRIGADATWYGEFSGRHYDSFREMYFPISARGCFVSQYECRRWQNEAMSFAGQGGMLYARCTQGAPGY
jgi:hypothetical protein